MTFNLFKNSADKVFKSPSVTFYFVLYLIILNYLTYYTLTPHTKLITAILTITTIVFSVAFSSGWLQIIKEKVKNDKEESYFSVFLEGVGKNIIPVSLGILIYIIILIMLIALTSLIAGALFGDLNSMIKDIILTAQGTTNINDFLNGLTDNQKYVLYAWQLSFMLVGAVYNFILLFYFPAILDDNIKANIFLKPFYALYSAVKFLFKNFLKSFTIFISIYFIYFLTRILETYSSHNSFTAVLILFFYIYFISYSVVLIFNCYEQKNLCSDGADSLGEDKCLDKIGEDN